MSILGSSNSEMFSDKENIVIAVFFGVGCIYDGLIH